MFIPNKTYKKLYLSVIINEHKKHLETKRNLETNPIMDAAKQKVSPQQISKYHYENLVASKSAGATLGTTAGALRSEHSRLFASRCIYCQHLCSEGPRYP